jgi:hypothetical protein
VAWTGTLPLPASLREGNIKGKCSRKLKVLKPDKGVFCYK